MGGLGGQGGAGGAGILNASGTVIVNNKAGASIAGGWGGAGGLYGWGNGETGASGSTGGATGSAGTSGASGASGSGITGGTGGTGGSGGTGATGGTGGAGGVAADPLTYYYARTGNGGAGVESQGGTLTLNNDGNVSGGWGTTGGAGVLVSGGTASINNGPSNLVGVIPALGPVSAVDLYGALLGGDGVIVGGLGVPADIFGPTGVSGGVTGPTGQFQGGAGIEITGGTVDINNRGGVIAGGMGLEYSGAGIKVSGGVANITNRGLILGGMTDPYYGIGYYGGYGMPGAGVHITGSGSASILNLGNIRRGSAIGEDGNGNVGVVYTAPGIVNEGTITSLINGQGGSTTLPLTFAGTLPLNYQVVVDDLHSNYGQMDVLGGSSISGEDSGMRFGLNAQYSRFTEVTAPKTYANVLTGIPGTVSAMEEQAITATGARNSGNWQGFINYAPTHWVRWKLVDVYDEEVNTGAKDLMVTFGPDADNTRAALALSAQSLQSMMRNRLGALTATTSYDCRYFDARGICVSVFSSMRDASGVSSTGTVGLIGVKLSNNWRLGGFVDNQGSTQRVGLVEARDRGTFGAYLGYDANPDGSGLRAKFSASMKNTDLSITRPASDADFTEPGRGKTAMDSSIFAAELGWGILNKTGLNVTPFIGARNASITRDGYTENGSASVVYPLTYQGYTFRPTIVTLGMQFNGKMSDTASYFVRAGLEQGSGRGAGTYGVTSPTALPIIGMSSATVSVNDRSDAQGYFGSAGLSFRVANGVYLFGNFTVRREPFSVGTGRYGMLGVSLAY